MSPPCCPRYLSRSSTRPDAPTLPPALDCCRSPEPRTRHATSVERADRSNHNAPIGRGARIFRIRNASPRREDTPTGRCPSQKSLAVRWSGDEMHSRIFTATVYEIFRLEKFRLASAGSPPQSRCPCVPPGISQRDCAVSTLFRGRKPLPQAELLLASLGLCAMLCRAQRDGAVLHIEWPQLFRQAPLTVKKRFVTLSLTFTTGSLTIVIVIRAR